MKDIRLLGDIVKHQLIIWHIPVKLYIGIENVLLLILSAKITYSIPFLNIVDNFQPLMVILIAVVYGYQSSLRALTIYALLGILGLPVFDTHQAGVMYIINSQQLGLLLGYVPASIVAATLSTYHWDRAFLSLISLFTLCISLIQLISVTIFSACHVTISISKFMPFLLSSGSIQAVIGTLFISICWQLSYEVYPELRS